MRSRYSAYVIQLPDYLFRTWHPRTRPEDVVLDPFIEWTGLKVLATTEDTVEFKASFALDGGTAVHHEVSRFEQRAGRWFYVDALPANSA